MDATIVERLERAFRERHGELSGDSRAEAIATSVAWLNRMDQMTAAAEDFGQPDAMLKSAIDALCRETPDDDLRRKKVCVAIAEAIGRLYRRPMVPEAVRVIEDAVEQAGPDAVESAAYEMLRDGACPTVRNPWLVLAARAKRNRNTNGQP